MLFHGALTLFNITGWAIPKLRKWNLALLLLTGFSWFVIGIFKGFGYCPLTDLHWNILEKAGKLPETNSYISFFLERLFNIHPSLVLVDTVTLISFSLALGLSVGFNYMDYKKMRFSFKKNGHHQ